MRQIEVYEEIWAALLDPLADGLPAPEPPLIAETAAVAALSPSVAPSAQPLPAALPIVAAESRLPLGEPSPATQVEAAMASAPVFWPELRPVEVLSATVAVPELVPPAAVTTPSPAAQILHSYRAGDSLRVEDSIRLGDSLRSGDRLLQACFPTAERETAAPAAAPQIQIEFSGNIERETDIDALLDRLEGRLREGLFSGTDLNYSF